MLDKDKNTERVERHHITQEDFTPMVIVEMMLDRFPESSYTDMSSKFLDPSCGIGNFLVEVLRRKLSHSTSIDDSIKALRSIYGVEIMADNVEECRNRLYNLFLEKHPNVSEDPSLNYKIRSIIKCRIRWHNSMLFNFETGWGHEDTYRPGDHENINFNEQKGKHKNYPMWSLIEDKRIKKDNQTEIPFDVLF